MSGFSTSVLARGDLDAVRRLLTTPEGLSAWWVRTTAVGPGLLEVRWGTGENHLVLRPRATRDQVRWDILTSPVMPEWVGSEPVFTLTEQPGGTAVELTHHGIEADGDEDPFPATWIRILSTLATLTEVPTPGDR